MLLGLSLSAFTLVHVLISLIAIGTGLVWLVAAWNGRRVPVWNAVFLITTIATSVTGFLFPATGFTPAQAFGLISLVVLALAVGALWRGAPRTYGIAAAVALYLNCFVLVVQAFQKIALLNALAPTGSEPPFAIVQALVLAGFILAGIRLFRRGATPPGLGR